MNSGDCAMGILIGIFIAVIGSWAVFKIKNRNNDKIVKTFVKDMDNILDKILRRD